MYLSDVFKEVFVCMLGVLIFQEQVMQIVIVVVGFIFGEVDDLCCVMVVWKCKGNFEKYQDKIISGMFECNYICEFVEQIFEQIKGFGEYGFFESYVVSFVKFVYVSSWFKCYEFVIFFVVLLNSQLMGFYLLL